MKNHLLLFKSLLFLLFVNYNSFSFGQSINNSKHINSSSLESSKETKINELVSKFYEYGKFNGSILVSENNNVIYKNAFGLANMEWEIPNSTTTKFRIASMTKQFTAFVILQLVAESKLVLNVPISMYLPDLPKEIGDKVTIHHLLSHTSGIPNFTNFGTYRDMMSKQMKPSEIVSVFADSTLLFTPGERFDYSNSAYVLLGVIIENITGKTFGQVLQDKIFIPLNMNNSGYEGSNEIVKNQAAGYNKNSNSFKKATYIDMTVAFSAGGIYSTVEDLFLWDQALYSNELLPEQYMDLMFTKHIPAWGNYYGYGWNISNLNLGNTGEKINTIDHDGYVNGFNSTIFRFPSKHASIIILNNTGGAPLYEMSMAIAGILYEKTYDLPKNSIANILAKSIQEHGIEEAEIKFNQLKNDNNFVLDENEMNILSFDFLHLGKSNEALKILELAISELPFAFNLYDSYGEIQNTLGNKKEAIKYYLKSVQLNPKNDNGLKVLKDLGVELNTEELYYINSNKTWSKEKFIFPLRFATDLKYKGIEEAHFPKGWRKEESSEFWSYAFLWNIDLNTELSKAELESHLQIYFDGLMNVVNKNKDFIIPKSIAKVVDISEQINLTKFTGNLELFDAFVKNEMFNLNFTVEKYYCKTEIKTLLFCRFSPKDYNQDIWKELEKITLRENACAY